jgi:hypothetical protein
LQPANNRRDGVVLSILVAHHRAVRSPTAEWYAAVQLGEEIVKRVNPLLINEAKAKTLRRSKA